MRYSDFAHTVFSRLVSLVLAYVLIFSSASIAPLRAGTNSLGKKGNLAKSAQQNAEKPERREGELLARFRHNTSESIITSMVESKGAHRSGRLRGRSGIERLTVAYNQNQDLVMAELSSDPNVEFVEPNYKIAQDQVSPNDPRFSEQWALQSPQRNVGGINATQAWQTTTGSWKTVIALIDSGIDFSHPDLRVNRWNNKMETADGFDNDKDGYIDDVNGWDWIANSNEIKDESGHGTALAGIIAAQGNNGTGITGVMWQAGLMSLRVLDKAGTGTVADAVEAIDYAANHGARIINCSWGTSGPSIALANALKRASLRGVVIVASAGNKGESLDSKPHYPASFDLANMIVVGSSDSRGQQADFSNYGAGHVTIAAPGVDILTTSMGGGYQKVSGTSASAAMVSGVAGLIETSRTGLAGEHVKDTIIKQARSSAALAGKNIAGGILNASDTVVTAKELFKGDRASGAGAQLNAASAVKTDKPNLSTTPAPTEPNLNLPDLDTHRKMKPSAPKAPDPVPSTLPALDDRNREDEIEVTENAEHYSGDSQTGPLLSLVSNGSTPDSADSGPELSAFEKMIDGGILGQYFNSINATYSSLKPAAPFYSTSNNFSEERLDPANRTGTGGEDLFSGNYSWGIPLVELKGRAGLDLSFGLAYNSLVWTKSGSSIAFDADHGFPTPGFRLGFPVIEPSFNDSRTGSPGAASFLMVTSSGGRAEFRYIGSSTYEAYDSSYTQLIDNHDGTLTVITAGGTRMTYTLLGSAEYHCTQIKDRNGNYITISYDSYRHPTTIVDTLNRTITFNYDSNHNPTSITQTWAGSTTHTWATFGYTTLTVQTNFTSLTLSGITNGTTINVLSQVGLADGSYSTFTYSSWGQVYQITNYAADNHELSHVSYNLPQTNSTAATDCPRFTQRSDYAENWNSGTAVTTSFSISTGQSWSKMTSGSDSGTLGTMTMPDGTIFKTYAHTSGWDEGLPQLEETWSDSTHRQRWVYTTWDQDSTSGVSYYINPRTTETDIFDSGNHKKTTVSYTSFTLPDGATVHLPSDTYDYQSDASTVLRQSHTDYITSSGYLSWHILGLPSAQYLYDGSSAVFSHMGYVYDDSGQISTQSAVQHDDTNYSTSFLTRGNVDKIRRYDISNSSVYTETQVTFNTDGSVLSTTDPSSHVSSISYTDSFSDSTNHSTYAYPTTVTDADSKQSTIKYNYDFGGATKTHDPKGAEVLTTYDSAGRISQSTNHDSVNNVDGSYIRYVYPTSQNIVQSYALINYGGSETYTAKLIDGAGRVYATAADHLGSTGGYRGQKTIYDTMGRASQKSNPAEMNSSWHNAGDDYNSTNTWTFTTQTYDWKGRPLVTTNPDSTTKTVSYGGCGCAGGEVVTYTDESGVSTRITADIAGRAYKKEVLNSSAGVYSTTTTTYNVRDQVTQADVATGTSGTYQRTTIGYDNYGRLSSKHLPIYDSGATTSYTYNSDDRIATVTDPRGVVATYDYTGYNRRLVSGISYSVPSGLSSTVPTTSAVSYTYDDASNRTYMSDGTGSTTYAHDTWGHITSETKAFSNHSGSFELQYTYNLGGQLASVTDPWGGEVTYTRDDSGQLTSVGGVGYSDNEYIPGTYYDYEDVTMSTFATNFTYRAWGGLKGLTYSNGSSGNALAISYNNRMKVTEYNAGGFMHATYTYRANDQVNYMHDPNDNRFDRSYEYDDYARLVTAKSGSEANGGSSSSWTGPYLDSYSYDVWGNMTGRSERLWRSTIYSGGTYSNNRHAGWTYDAAGHITADTPSKTYDAAGINTYSDYSDLYQAYTLAESFDADGHVVYRDQEITYPSTSSEIRWYIRSTVLGGNVVGELTDGSVPMSWVHIYANGEPLAKIWCNGYVQFASWEHKNPVSGTTQTSDIGVVGGGGGLIPDIKEMNPLSQEVGTSDPYAYTSDPTYSDLKSGDSLLIEGGDPFDLSGGCSEWGMPMSCSSAAQIDHSGVNDWDPIVLVQVDSSGQTKTGGTPLNSAPGLLHEAGNFFGPNTNGSGIQSAGADASGGTAEGPNVSNDDGSATYDPETHIGTINVSGISMIDTSPPDLSNIGGPGKGADKKGDWSNMGGDAKKAQIANIIWTALSDAEFSDCAKLLNNLNQNGEAGSAKDLFSKFFANNVAGGFIFKPDLGYSGLTSGYGENAVIQLGPGFVVNSKIYNGVRGSRFLMINYTLNLATPTYDSFVMAQALLILHELGHATGRYSHSKDAVPGKYQEFIDENKLDKAIADKCLTPARDVLLKSK